LSTECPGPSRIQPPASQGSGLSLGYTEPTLVAASRCGQLPGCSPWPAGPVLDCPATYRWSRRCQPVPPGL